MRVEQMQQTDWCLPVLLIVLLCCVHTPAVLSGITILSTVWYSTVILPELQPMVLPSTITCVTA